MIGVANSGGFIAPELDPRARRGARSGSRHRQRDAFAARRRSAPGSGRPTASADGLSTFACRPPNIPIGTGLKRSGKRLLTVGTDCALGKKYTALAIARAFAARGLDVDFRATGQTGIMIAGAGIPMDAVVSDFAAGAAEMLSPAAPDDHWDVIEGQGSILHPGYAGVSLALLHGSQPDCFIVCHDPGRTRLLGDEAFAVPSIEEIIDLTIRLGSRTNPKIRCGGVALNTSALAEAEAAALCASKARALAFRSPTRCAAGQRSSG